ncbi:MAG: flagellar export chaperone FliS [Desulfovibrionaceae bacterium]|nr:flagellar export chaperone FliS [Desulfovibrionaceae bacterium]
MLKAKQAYFQTQVTTTTQGELVVLLYDGAIKYLRLAKEKIAAKDFAEKGILISKALDIIQELDSSLNMEQGGEISVNLHSLYIFAQRQLLQANLKMDQKLVDEVITMLSSLRDAFAAIINTPEALQAQKLAPEQAPVNVSQFRNSGPFGINEARPANVVPAPVASMSTRARAYQQQASSFAQPANSAGIPAGSAQPAANQPPAQSPFNLIPPRFGAQPSPAEQGPVQAAQKSANAQAPSQAGFSAQPSVQAQAQAEAAAQPSPAGTSQPAPAQPALSPNQQMHSQALTGFARQMINNSLYKKMALNNQTQTAEK